MKAIIKEFLYIIYGFSTMIVLCLGFYLLFSTLMHYNYLNDHLLFTESHGLYIEFQTHIDNIDKDVASYHNNDDKYHDSLENIIRFRDRLSICNKYLKDESGLLGLKENDLVSDYNLYQLNEYFIDKLVNECWVKSLADFYYEDDKYRGDFKYRIADYIDYVDSLVTQSNYLKKELKSNYTMHYTNISSQMTSRNESLERLNMVLNMYNDFSKIIDNLSDYIVDGDQQVIRHE